MTAYMIGMMKVTDKGAYEEYKKYTPVAVAKYDGKFLSRGGTKVTLEGEEESRRVVIVEFPSLEKAQAFYNSSDYQHAITYRKNAAIMQLVVVEGFEQLG
ncbi:MAG: DUF1330 domain-containing protein [Tolypothrix carrinoi HA7290-LM1]|jgi:uncharacterized protein (DUF1330 family)|nr:DUF1330 domain-containing protein [Tolypothrix carrinoi HA7290-LM1]